MTYKKKPNFFCFSLGNKKKIYLPLSRRASEMTPAKPQTRGGSIERPTATHVIRRVAHMGQRTEDGTEVIRDAPRGADSVGG